MEVKTVDVNRRSASDAIEEARAFYAELITASVGAGGNTALKAAFASTPRERFVGSGPWRVLTPGGYLSAPGDNPALLYQDTTVAIAPERHINNGQPSLHAACLSALHPREGETAVHIGAGTGYYTAILAKLVGPTGRVLAYELEPDLAQRAAENLAELPNVTVYARSGTQGRLPDADLIYVNAGATAPLGIWLESLRAGGRLLFPLTPATTGDRPGVGGMLLVTKLRVAEGVAAGVGEGMAEDQFAARFLCLATFIPCVGGRDDETAERLSEAFARGDFARVRSLRLGDQPDDTSWFAADGWWLSTTPVEAGQ